MGKLLLWRWKLGCGCVGYKTTADSPFYKQLNFFEQQVPVKLVSIPRGTLSVGPASSIASNADDMGKWILFLLGDSHPHMDHGRVIETFKNEFVFGAPQFLKPFNAETMAINDMYGRGWMNGYYRGT